MANRINQLIDESAAKTGVKRGAVIAAVAKRCGIAGPSVYGWINGTTKRLTGMNLLRAAQYWDVNPEWLATGRGPRVGISLPPVSPASETFDNVEKQLITWFRALPPNEKGKLLGDLASRYYALTDGANQAPGLPDALAIEGPKREHGKNTRKTAK